MHTKLQNLRLVYRRQITAVCIVVLLFCAIIASLLAGKGATAATATTINFQARLMNAAGAIAPDGNYNIEFKLYDTASGGGTAQGVCTGNCKWVETRTGAAVVTVANGYITVNLGSENAFGSTINWDQDLWLTMNIGGTGSPSWDGEMSPRLKLTAVPYAFRAAQLARYTTNGTGVLQLAASFSEDTTITLPDPGASTATVCYQNSTACGFVTGGSTNFIQNGTSVQNAANFNIRSANAGSVGAVIQGANGQTADLLNLQTWNGTTATTVLGVSSSGVLSLSTLGTANNAAYLCLNGSSQVATCSSTVNGAAFIQGGNDFDTTAVLGTTGADNLQVITNNVTRATFDTSNGLYLGNGVTHATPNNFTLSVTGSATAGTAGANLTIQGGAGASSTSGSAGGGVTIAGGNAAGSGDNAGGNVVLQGGLDANNGTPGKVLVKNSADSATAFQVQNAAGSTTVLNVDTTNGYVGIGTNAPGRALDVAVNNSSVTALPLRLIQQGSGDVGLQLTGSSNNSFYIGQDTSSSDALVISSSTAAGGYSTPTHIQSSVGSNSSSVTGNTISQTFGSPNTLGNTIIAGVTWFGAANLFTSCSDTLGNSYTIVHVVHDSTQNQNAGVCYATNIIAGSNTVTANFPAGTVYRAISISEFSNIATTNSVDVYTGAAGNGTTPSSGSIVTTQPSDLIYGLVMDTAGINWSDTSIAPGAGFTERGENDGLSPESQVQSSAGSISANWTFNSASDYAAIAIAFKAATGTISDNFSTPLLKLSQTGSLTVKNSVDSASALQVQNAAGVNLIALDTSSRILNLGVTGSTASTSTINIGTSTGAAQTVAVGSTASTSSTALQAGTGNLTVNTAGTVRATFNNTNIVYFGNGVSAGAPNDFTISGTGGVGVAGAKLTLQGGSATSGSFNGGNLALTGGAGSGTGVRGLVVIDTPTITTASTQACASNCTITQANIDSTGAILVNATALSLTATLSDPTITTAGRIMYVTNVGSNDFTLSVNGGGAGNTIAMKPNTTATMIWNGSDWTAAGASSSTDLQSAYNNTLTSAGGAELVLNAPGGSADGLTIRNNATTPITGGILEVQTSIGSNLLSVNNNATEYATNGGAETTGASASTFPSNTWDTTTGGTVDRWTTAGDNIATGQASVRVQTTTNNHGARNRISASLTSGLTYSVSFAVRGAVNFGTLQVLYSPDGTTTGTTQCATAQTVTSGIWTRISCSFVASGTIISSNSILIRQTDGTARTFYVDNLSVNVNASATFAADGSVDNAGTFATNWTDFDGGTGSTTITRETAVIYDTSASTAGATTANATQGIRNNMAITPSINTQYLVSFYARSTNTMTSSLAVGFLPAGGTTAPTGTAACTDYNTQSLTANTWTKITCLFTTTATTISNPDLVIYQTDGTARTIYVDALSITLNTNNSNNVQIGGANKGGPATLFTLDRANTAPIAANNEAYLGSMYYDTTSGRIQCYEADGWGACGAAPDNIVNLNPEYAGAVLNGTGIGTMTADFCANQSSISFQVNTTLCSNSEARNFYKWTSPQATEQTYSIYVTYQLPATFNGFASDDTIQLVGRVDSTTNAAVTYQMYAKTTNGSLSQCSSGSSETTVTTSINTWQPVGINGNEATGCGLNSSYANGFIIFKINMKARSNATAYVSTLSFTTTGR